MITLPFGLGIARMNEAMIQPRAGRLPPAGREQDQDEEDRDQRHRAPVVLEAADQALRQAEHEERQVAQASDQRALRGPHEPAGYRVKRSREYGSAAERGPPWPAGPGSSV